MQKESNYPGDVYQLIKQDMTTLNISEDDVIRLSKGSLKELIKKQTSVVAFDYLYKIAESHSKVQHQIYKDLKGMQYFEDNRFSSDQIKLLFKLRTRMFDVRNNFRNNYECASCPLCGLHRDTQDHLLSCVMIQKHFTPSIMYDDIFSEDCNTLLKTTKEFEKIAG